MIVFVFLDLLYILHSLVFFWTSHQQPLQASGPEFAMYHTVNFFVWLLNIYAILCVTSQYQEITASNNQPSNDFRSSTLPRVTSHQYKRHSFATKKKLKKINDAKNVTIASVCGETTFVSKSDSVVSDKYTEKTGRRKKSRVSFTENEAMQAGGSQPIKLSDTKMGVRDERTENACTTDAHTGQNPAEIATTSSDICKDNMVMNNVITATKLNIQHSSPKKKEVNDHILSDLVLSEEQLVLGVHRLKDDLELEDTSLIKRRQALRFNSLQPLQKLSVPSSGLHFSSLSLNYPQSSSPSNGHDFQTPLLTAPLSHSKLRKYKNNLFPKTASVHDMQPLEHDFPCLSPEQRGAAVIGSSRIFQNTANKFTLSSPTARSSIMMNTKNDRSLSHASLQEHVETRSFPKSVYFNSTVEEVVFVDFTRNIVESSFDCSESTSSTCSGSSLEGIPFNSE
ncbi:hypothetical protein FHG87_020687 [Trinorchestia longiramus]|nr:hypothetical protein FHG87_020687 [Trinorchestia longiramus]